jgi:hypothetical protein
VAGAIAAWAGTGALVATRRGDCRTTAGESRRSVGPSAGVDGISLERWPWM